MRSNVVTSDAAETQEDTGGGRGAGAVDAGAGASVVREAQWRNS
jgi:hypothetical protein